MSEAKLFGAEASLHEHLPQEMGTPDAAANDKPSQPEEPELREQFPSDILQRLCSERPFLSS